MYKDLLKEQSFYKETKNDTLLKVQEPLHIFVYNKARHILGNDKIQEIRSIVLEDEAKRIAKQFPSVPKSTKGKGKRKKTKKKKTRKGKKQKRRK